MKIPKQFKLFAQTIKTKIDGGPFVENSDFRGFASYRLNEIQIKPDSDSAPLDNEQTSLIYCHELAHFLLYFSEGAYKGKTKHMHQDEDFVELLGNLLHQYFETVEY